MSQGTAPQRLIGMLIFPRLTQLDMTGPYEVLARLPNTLVHLVAHTLDPVKTDRGMMIVPTVGLSAVLVAVAAVVAAIIAERIPSERLLGVAFSAVSILLAIAAVTILRRVMRPSRSGRQGPWPRPIPAMSINSLRPRKGTRLDP